MDAASISRRADDPRVLARRAAPARGLRSAATRLLRYLGPQRGAAVLGVVVYFGSAALEPLLPALFNRLIDHGFKADLGFPFWWVPAIVVGLFALRGTLVFAGAYLFARATSHAVLDLRTDMIQALMRSDASLFVDLSPGVAAARIINDPQNAVQSIVGAGTSLLREGTTLVALLGYLFYLNWRLTLISMIAAPAIGMVVRHVQRRVVAVGGESYESQVRLTGIVDDIARAWRVVRSFDAETFERARFGAEAQQLRRTTFKATTAGAMMTPLTQLIASLGVATVLTMALVEANRGGSTVGEFVAFVTALLLTISPLRRLTDITQPIIGGLIQARACFDLVDTPAEPDAGIGEIDKSAGELTFEHTSVDYAGGERPALSNVDLHFPAGRTTALVGPSGSGKSTVVSTLLGFVAPSHGRVLLDGVDIGSLRKASLRRQFAVVSQDIVLFDGSIDDNVAYALPKDPDRIEACLRAADLWEFVQGLPAQGATRVGTNGGRFSGGQRQRLAIARALYKEASIWIFDEATSALDSESERLVHLSIDRWRGSRTLVLIAHRLSTVRHADCIHVLVGGRVVESGRHAALMALDGVYASMVRAQTID